MHKKAQPGPYKYDDDEDYVPSKKVKYSLADEDEDSVQIKKHTLDSDEEDEEAEEKKKAKYDVLRDEDIDGQEDATIDMEGETKITPFNMKEELEEGHFDRDGFYHFKKETETLKDAWLDNIDWIKVKRDGDGTKKYGSDVESDSDDNTPLPGGETQKEKESLITVYEEIFPYLGKGETIAKALKRLGGNTKRLSSAERWKLKKQGKLDSASEGNLEEFLKLTELVNKIMDTGNMDIYQETFEMINLKIQRFRAASSEPAMDMFSDEVTSTSKEDGTSTEPDSQQKDTFGKLKMKSSDKMSHISNRKRSDVWKFYSIVKANRARCEICRVELTFAGGSTTNLHRHINTKHPNLKVTKKQEPNEQETVESSSGDVSVRRVDQNYGAGATTESQNVLSTNKPENVQANIDIDTYCKRMPPAKQRKVDEALLKMVVKDYQPFSIVDDTGFRNFMRLLNPTYCLPNCKALAKNVLPEVYERTLHETKQSLHVADSVCLTIDSWTSATTDSYIAVTCYFISKNFVLESYLLECFLYSERHTAENLKTELVRVANDWGVASKIVTCVTDNSANVVAAVKLTGWEHLPCFAHMLNSIVNDSLREIKSLIEKIKSIVEFMHRSTYAAEKLRLTQRQLSLGELKLKNDVPTRWNSTYYMLERFLQQKEAIITTMTLVNPSHPLLSAEEWDIVKESCDVLKPFEEVTKEIILEQTVFASKVIIMARGLQEVSNNISVRQQLKQPVQNLLNRLKVSMGQQFLSIEYNTQLSEASVMDPRFKKFVFIDENAAEEAIKSITTAAAGQNETRGVTEPTSVNTSITSPTQTSSAMFWKGFDSRCSEVASLQTSKSEAIMEVRSFMEEPLLPRNEDPLMWWKARCLLYKRLTKVMITKLCVVATSVPCERIFSKTGQIISDRRNRLSSRKVKQIVFLNRNLR